MYRNSQTVSPRTPVIRGEKTSSYYRITDESIFELCDLVCGSIHGRLVAELDELGPTPRS